MKRKCISLALALVMVVSLIRAVPPVASAALPEGSIIQDVYFYELVLERMGKPYGYVITPEDASSFEHLDVSMNPQDVNPRRILNLSGIEYFTEIQTLSVVNHFLTDLDLSKNTKLTAINCDGNYLTTLNVSNLTALKYLNCSKNRLTTLNVSGCTDLESVGANDNRLTAIDVTGLSNLRILNAHENYIQSIDDIMGINTTLLVEGNIPRVILDRQKPLSERESALRADAAAIAGIAAFAGNEITLSPYEYNLKMYNESEVKRDAIAQISGGGLEYAEEIASLAASITDGITGHRAKAEAIHQWIADNIWYNYDWSGSGIEPIFTAPLDVLKYRYTVCDGFARLNAALLGASGIPAVYAAGDPVGRGESHAWNEVYVDGRWIISDVTNDSRNSYSDAQFSEQSLGRKDRFDVTVEWISARYRTRGYSVITVKEQVDRPDPLDSASAWAREGITNAIDKGFVPDHLKNDYTSAITRKEFCYVAIRWLMYARDESIGDIIGGRHGRDGGLFQDTKDSYIRSAYELYITNGTSNNTFAPNGLITREQAATMIMNACKVVGIDVSNTASAGFADIDEASGWAVGAINFVRNAGIMGGVGDGRFDPKAIYTREQSILTFHNITAPEMLPRGEPNPAFAYRVIGNTVTILGYHGEEYTGDSDTVIIIPPTIEGRPVTAIGGRAFGSHKNLTTVTIPDSVTIIDRLAFSGCINLTQITIPSSVTSIGEAAFSRCTSLTSIIIPGSVTSIGDGAFSGCTSLSAAYFDGDTPELGAYVFDQCAQDFTAYYHDADSR